MGVNSEVYIVVYAVVYTAVIYIGIYSIYTGVYTVVYTVVYIYMWWEGSSILCWFNIYGAISLLLHISFIFLHNG